MARSPGFEKHPDYRVDIRPCEKRVRVRFAGETVADSARALRVEETRHDPVLYFPREDLRMEAFDRTDHVSFCPFKGEASYFSLRAGARVAENAVWSYEDPYDEVRGLKDHVAFYADRVETIEG